MDEKEIDRILNPKKRFTILLFIYLSIAFLCIGFVFFMYFVHNKKESIVLSESVLDYQEKIGQEVILEIDILPVWMIPNLELDSQFYYVIDTSNQIYIMSLSSTTFKEIVDMFNPETEKLNSIYQLKGIIYPIDEQIKELAILNGYRVFPQDELNLDNFSKYLDAFYIKESPISETRIIVYTVLVLFGLFFLVLAFGYILPSILMAHKVCCNSDLIDELRSELGNLTNTPYRKQRIYLTKHYIVFGIQAIQYEDVIWVYVEDVKKYGMTVGRNLVVYDQNQHKHIIGSIIGTKNSILDCILADIQSRNSNIKVGYNEENKDFFGI